ncbi:hypothetical protein [Sphingobium yanoikuyae]|uniref:hypothetical protein n=1 Tax=Sphingobium yanoikuyae TaxID=13690 RepID=UPI0026EA1CF0|nr:hypothetical protein [Sphingobium yanoikuyae]
MSTQILPQVKGGVPIFTYEELIAAGTEVPEFIEPDLLEDYSFDLDAATSFRSRLTYRSALLNTTGKTINLVKDEVLGKYLSIPVGYNGLRTNLPDMIGMSWGGAFQWQDGVANALQMYGGSAAEGSATGGELVYKRPTGSITLGVRNVADIQFTAGVVSAMGITNGKWFFFVVTNEWVDQVAGTSRHNFYIITQDGAHLASGTGTKIPATPARNVAIGNPGLTTTNYDLMAINCARFFTAQRTLAQDEIVDIYTRARIIAERRGIELV